MTNNDIRQARIMADRMGLSLAHASRLVAQGDTSYSLDPAPRAPLAPLAPRAALDDVMPPRRPLAAPVAVSDPPRRPRY